MKSKFFIPLMILLVIMIIQFAPVIFSRNTYFSRDLTYQFHPMRVYAAEQIQSGHMPLWNPYSYSGMPFMANMQSAIWYPFSILFYIFPFALGLKFFHLLHFIIAGYLAFLLARHYRVCISVSLITGILFAMNGYLITKLEFLSLLGSAVWLPGLFIFKKNAFRLGLLFTLSYLSGYPQLLLLQIAGIIIFMLFTSSFTLKKMIPLCTGGIGALMLSAIQFIPAVELLRHSMRAVSGLTLHAIGLYSLHIRDFISIAFPWLAGTHIFQVTGEKFMWITGMHIGITGSIIIAAGFRHFKTSKKYLFLIFSIMIIVFCMGTNTPLFTFLFAHNIPFVRLFRFPSSMLYLLMALVIPASLYFSRVKHPYKLLALCALVTELLLLNTRILPVIDSAYFHHKGALVSFLQHMPRHSRYLLTPRTQNASGGLFTRDISSGWYTIKSRLHGLSGLPFHVYDADGANEPLVLQVQRSMINNVLSQGSITSALKHSVRASVRYLVSAYHVLDDHDIKHLPDGLEVVVNEFLPLDQPLSRLYYPGWKAYLNGKRIPIVKDAQGWMSHSGNIEDADTVRYVYRPGSFNWGLIISLCCIVIMFVYGIALAVMRRPLYIHQS